MAMIRSAAPATPSPIAHFTHQYVNLLGRVDQCGDTRGRVTAAARPLKSRPTTAAFGGSAPPAAAIRPTAPVGVRQIVDRLDPDVVLFGEAGLGHVDRRPLQVSAIQHLVVDDERLADHRFVLSRSTAAHEDTAGTGLTNRDDDGFIESIASLVRQDELIDDGFARRLYDHPGDPDDVMQANCRVAASTEKTMSAWLRP